MVDKDDEALERMRAADPAIGSHPDLFSLRRRLSRSTPLGLTGGVDDDLAVPVRDVTTRGSRTSIVAAAAVVALGLGVGGYTIGAQTAAPDGDGATVAGDTADEEQAARDRAEEQARREAGSAAGAEEGTETMGAGDSGMGMGGGDSASSMAAMLPVVLTAGPGLSTSGGTGEVTALQAPDLDEAAFLAAWAQQLGLEGEPSGDENYQSLTDGTVTISVYGGTYPSFDYMDTALDPYCAEILGGGDSAGTTEPAVDILPAPTDCAEPSGGDLTEEQALATASAFLEQAGIGADAYELTVEPWTTDGDVAAYYVNGALSESALPQQQWVNVTVTADGVATANGQLEPELVPMGEYPVVSPVEAVERLSDPRFANWGAVYVPSLDDQWMPLEEEWVEPDWPDVDTTPGAQIPFWLTEGTVVEARLEEGMLSVPSGDEFVVPAYVLTDNEGRHHTMIALAEGALDFTP